MKKNWLSFILLMLTFIVFIVIILLTDGIDKFISNLSNINLIWFCIALLAMLLYWILEAIILHIFVKLKYKKFKFSSSFRVSMIGQFFNSITPFSSGGQPMQLYALTKDEIGSGEAGSILIMKFIVFQVILAAYCLLIILFKYSFFAARVDKFMLLTIVGFGIHFLVIVLLVVLTIYPNVAKGLISFTVNICTKFKILKETKGLEKKIEKELQDFKTGSEGLRENIKILIYTGILTVIQLTIYFSIAYFLYKGFESEKGGNFINILSANAFVTMIATVVPLPGSAGGAEGSFYVIFNSFLSEGKILPTIFLWRFITFYLNLIVGGIYTILPSEGFKKKKKKIIYKERKTTSE